MRSTQEKKIALENETHRPAPRYCKLQPILEPGNHENLHYGLRVFVHFVFPYVNQMSQKYHTNIIRLVVKRQARSERSIPGLSEDRVKSCFSSQRRCSTTIARNFAAGRPL